MERSARTRWSCPRGIARTFVSVMYGRDHMRPDIFYIRWYHQDDRKTTRHESWVPWISGWELAKDQRHLRKPGIPPLFEQHFRIRGDWGEWVFQWHGYRAGRNDDPSGLTPGGRSWAESSVAVLSAARIRATGIESDYRFWNISRVERS